MSGETKILRKWTGVDRTADEQVYVDYIKATGLEDYKSTPGNLGFQMVLRARGDGTSEVTTLSWWTSLEAIKAFAGDDPEVARHYPRTTSSWSSVRKTSTTIASWRVVGLGGRRPMAFEMERRCGAAFHAGCEGCVRVAGPSARARGLAARSVGSR
ncbi:hypothetical protein ACSBOB_14485 [Mesorhizobium sp. ASY16-5R]|uniref:hypothetical protein n=1 Tax=Mesorhizobium sp. ASY16-5R TaxID=3445772 RepID=UPI003FA14A95